MGCFQQSAPTFLFFHYSLLLQRLQDQQQKKKLLKATAVLLQRQLRESRERQTEAELRLEGFQKLQQQQALESAAAAQCAPNLFSAAMPLALQPPSLFGGHTNLPFGAEGARPLQTATASIASAIRPRPQPPPPRDATEAVGGKLNCFSSLGDGLRSKRTAARPARGGGLYS